MFIIVFLGWCSQVRFRNFSEPPREFTWNHAARGPPIPHTRAITKRRDKPSRWSSNARRVCHTDSSDGDVMVSTLATPNNRNSTRTAASDGTDSILLLQEKFWRARLQHHANLLGIQEKGLKKCENTCHYVRPLISNGTNCRNEIPIEEVF